MEVGEVGQRLVAGFAGRGDGGEAAVVHAVGGTHLGRDDVVEQGSQGRHHEVQCSRDEQGHVAGLPVLADASDPLGERLGDDQVAEHLRAVGVDAVYRSAVEAAVEVTQEVAAVAAVQRQQPRCLRQRAGGETHPVEVVEVPCGQPRVAGHDIRGDQSVLQVEDGELALGCEDLAAQPRRAGLSPASPGAGRHLQPGLRHHRRQVHLLHVVGPVQDARVEAEFGAVGVVERVPQSHEAVQLIDGLALGVGAVELDVVAGPLELKAAFFEAGAHHGVASPQRQSGQYPVGGLQRALGPLELPGHPAAPGEGPARHGDRLVVLVVNGVLGEPSAHQVEQRAVLDRVDGAAGDLGDVGAGIDGAPGGHGQDGGHDQIHRDHVDDALGHPGELFEQSPGVGGDHRLGHAESPDPSRIGLGQGRLDDRGPHDAHRDVAAGLGQGPLTEGLGEGVGVGEPEAGRPGPARLGHLVVHPAAAQALHLLGQRGYACRAQLPAGLDRQRGQALGAAAGLLGVAAGPAGAGDLIAPADVGEERRLVHQLLGRGAPPAAGHVAGGHRDQVRLRAGLVQHRSHPGRSEQVDLHGVVEGRVEVHGGRRVDHGVAAGQQGPALVVESEPVGAHVPGEGFDPPGRHLVVGLGRARAGRVATGLLAEPVEGVVAQHVALHPRGRAPPTRAHQQHQLAVGHATQQTLGERGPQKPGRAGDGDALAG